MPKGDTTQFERAKILLAYFSLPVKNELLLRQLDTLLDEAQNEPPHGKNDGSLDESTWTALRDLLTCAARYRDALQDALSATQPRKRGQRRASTPKPTLDDVFAPEIPEKGSRR